VHLHLPFERSAQLVWRSAEELESLPLPAPQRRVLKLAQAQGNLKG
jgi:hypothetical protein